MREKQQESVVHENLLGRLNTEECRIQRNAKLHLSERFSKYPTIEVFEKANRSIDLIDLIKNISTVYLCKSIEITQDVLLEIK